MDGKSKFIFDGKPLDCCLSDFWEWYASDLLHGPLRGAVAEYVVAQALELDCSAGRNLWAAYDLEYNGHSIEIKSSAYLQKKERVHLTNRVTFSIDAHKHNATKTRHTEIYVFCLIHCKDETVCNPMDLGQWMFYILPTSKIVEKLGDNRSVSLSTLLSLNPTAASYATLKAGIDDVCKTL